MEGKLEPRLLQDLELMVSEVVTNAITHGELRHGEYIKLRIDCLHDRIRVEVLNRGQPFEPVLKKPVSPRQGGYGLLIVDELSDAWGVENEKGTKVWLERRKGVPS